MSGVHKAWLAAGVRVFLWSKEERADALRAIFCGCGVPAAARARAHGAGMPVEVLDQCSREMKNWNGSGMGVAEMSHRGKVLFKDTIE